MFGLKVVSSTQCIRATSELDFSRVRSPSRALRRIKAGKRKAPIPFVMEPYAVRMFGMLVAHPSIIDEIRRQVETP